MKVRHFKGEAAIRITLGRFLLLLTISIALAASAILTAIFLLNAVRVGDSAHTPGQQLQINDFIAQYAGAQLAARGQPERIYDPEQVHALEREIAGNTDTQLLPALYPPFLYLMLMPLAGLALSEAYRVWTIITLCAAMLAAFRITPHWHTLVFVLVFPAVALSVATGQNGNLSAALIGAGLILLPTRPLVAGISFGLLAAYKPQLALAIPFCLIGGRHYRTLTVMAATVAATILLSLVAFGAETILAFLSSISATTHAHFDDSSSRLWGRMPTVLSSMLQLREDSALAWTMQGISAAIALAALIYVWHRSTLPTPRALSLVASIPLATPYLFDYDLAILLIPMSFIMRDIWFSGIDLKRFCLVTALWVMPPTIYFAAAFQPATAFWPIAPIVWMSLLAYTVSTSNEDAIMRKF